MSIKVGDKVRVSRKPGDGWEHGIKFGAVCTVMEVFPNLNEVRVTGPVMGTDEWERDQYISMESIKLAKQANRKS